MLLLGQVLEDIRENLFAAKDKNFNLIKKNQSFCFTDVVGCSTVDDGLNVGCCCCSLIGS
jgi:hypothetical protein